MAAPGEALVARIDFGGLTLVGPDGAAFEAIARGALMGPKKSLGNTVVVGDRVTLAWEGGRAIVESVAPRRNAFSRRAAGERAEEQVVAANLDQVVVVAALADPPFRPGFVDRVLSQAEHFGIPARLVLNKVDLGEAGEAESILKDYAHAGYPGHALNARSGEGLESVRHAVQARRSLLVGHSGVGKSTLLNALAPGAGQLAGDVNEKTGRGKHTTTAAVMIRPEPDFEIIDTPGVRSFALWGIGARDLEQSYIEFRRHLGECRFGDCSHVEEPGCALRAAVESGAIARRRFESFLKLRDELAQEERMALGRARGRR